MFINNGSNPSDMSDLNIEDPNDQTNRYFNYTIISADAANFNAKATRKEGKYNGKAVYIDKSGTITADSGYFTP